MQEVKDGEEKKDDIKPEGEFQKDHLTEYLLQPPPMRRPPIDTSKVLGLVEQAQNIIITKNLTPEQITALICNCSVLIGFVERDNYPEPFDFTRMFKSGKIV